MANYFVFLKEIVKGITTENIIRQELSKDYDTTGNVTIENWIFLPMHFRK